MASAAKSKATYEDLVALPDNVIGELIHGVLHANPRPAKPHAAAAAALGEELGPPFKRGRGGWRRERMPTLDDAAFFTLAPDWVCEVLSARTAKVDRTEKLPIYAAHGVGHAWLVDPRLRTLEVLRRDGALSVIVGTYQDDARVRAEPFDAIELELGILWADVVFEAA